MSTTKEITKNLGGNRLGSGNKTNVNLHAYNRSTHDLTRTWRSSMNVGTLVPFLVEIGLNGDTFSINLDNITRTLPSTGPLYGSYKLQLDVFECPIRLYNGLLHNNMTSIGLNMSQVKFPKIILQTRVRNREVYNEDLNKSQISKSSLMNYLGLNGIADYDFTGTIDNTVAIRRNFNAIPLLAYWDIYKNYYANKQEGDGALITADPKLVKNEPTTLELWNIIDGITMSSELTESNEQTPPAPDLTYLATNDEIDYSLGNATRIIIKGWKSSINYTQIRVVLYDIQLQSTVYMVMTDVEVLTNNAGDVIMNLPSSYAGNGQYNVIGIMIPDDLMCINTGLHISKFNLQDIDDIRIEILRTTGLNEELILNNLEMDNYLCSFMTMTDEDGCSFFKYGQHGLALKTYQSDIYNNWLQTEWIDGNDGINKITAIDTSSGSFEIDAFILAKKIYNMLNRVAVSGGSYEDWQEAVYSVKAIRRAETPVYRGGMSAEIMFSEVVSNAATEDDPLGTLAGKGGEHGKKGGQIEISCDEPCIIMGIVSITPRVDYSQGNSWILTELDNMDDLHKPALDGIGFQDLLQERMAYFGTYFQNGELVKLAAGKIPAWLHYMTAVNETHGDFAEEDKCMFMTLNRRYEYFTGEEEQKAVLGINDLTTYIDPRKYNYIFADSSLEAQNFWVQIGIGITARRVMSAKVIPFL